MDVARRFRILTSRRRIGDDGDAGIVLIPFRRIFLKGLKVNLRPI